MSSTVFPVSLATYRSRFNFECLRRADSERSIRIRRTYLFVIIIEKTDAVKFVK